MLNELQNQNTRKRLSTAAKIGYGAVEGACSMVWTIYLLFFLIFLTDVVGMEPAVAGAIMMIGVLWDGVTDPLIGMISDRSRLKWGRRRPFLLVFAFPLAISYWLLFTDWGLGDSQTFIYFTAAVILFFTSFTALNIPTSALAAEMTEDYNERTSLTSYRAAWSQIFSIIGSTSPLLLVAWLMDFTGDKQGSWSLAGAIFGVVAVPLTLISWRSTRGHERNIPTVNSPLGGILSDMLGNRVFLWTIAVWTAALVAQATLGTSLVYLMTYRIGLDESQASTAFLVLFVSSTAWIPVIRASAAKFGKRATFSGFALLWASAQTLLVFVKEGDLFTLCIILAVIGAGVVLPWQLGWALLADVVEVDEFKSGQRREGVYFGIAAFLQKAASGIAVFLVGWVLTKSGYQPDGAQTEATLEAISWTSSFAVSLFAVIAAFCVTRVPMTKDKHASLILAIQARADGKPVDTSGFDDIL